MPADRRTWTRVGVGAIAVALAVWSLRGEGQAPAAAPAAARQAARAPAARPTTIEDVRIDTLTAQRAEPAAEGRNPFRFEARRPAVAEPPATDAPAVTPALAAPAPAGPPPLPPIPFKFIGLVEGAAGARIAVLSDSRGLVVHGGEGAIIDGRFRILAIGAETLDIAYADGRGRQTLRLTGQ